MTLAVGDFSNDIKSIELKPPGKVAAVWVSYKELLGLVEEQLGSVVDKGLILDQCAHGKGRVDTATELGVKVVVGGAEQRCQPKATDDGLLDNVEVGLQVLDDIVTRLDCLP
jgi:hypothetical protein